MSFGKLKGQKEKRNRERTDRQARQTQTRLHSKKRRRACLCCVVKVLKYPTGAHAPSEAAKDGGLTF